MLCGGDDDDDEHFDDDDDAHENHCCVSLPLQLCVVTATASVMLYQLSFADATYVLQQYRHLFPCVPTSDAAW